MGLGEAQVRQSLALLFMVVVCPALYSMESIGYIRGDIYAREPLSPGRSTTLSFHYTNISPAPVLLCPDMNDFVPALLGGCYSVSKGFDPAEPYDSFGPSRGKQVPIVQEKVEIVGSGMPGHPNARRKWPDRAGFIIVKDEGYARHAVYRPGWPEGTTNLPAAKGWVLIIATMVFYSALPILEPNAVAPGQLVRFGPMKVVGVSGMRPVPFSRFAEKDPAPGPVVEPKQHAVQAELEVHGPVEAGKDLTAVYLIGNVGTEPVWIRPNDLVPAHATWVISKGAKEAATIDGSAVAPLAALLPARPAELLNPGEYRTWRRVLLASSLSLKAGATYDLTVKIDVPYFASAPTHQDKPKVETLSAQSSVMAK